MMETLDQILASAIYQAQMTGRDDVTAAAEEAAKAYAAGLAAFKATRPAAESSAAPSATQ